MAKRQTEIPGCEAPSIPELDDVIAQYIGSKMAHARERKAEADDRKLVQEKMRELKVASYRYNDGEDVFDLELEEAEKLRCKRISEKIEIDDDGTVDPEGDEVKPF
jgi:hypothetical protein